MPINKYTRMMKLKKYTLFFSHQSKNVSGMNHQQMLNLFMFFMFNKQSQYSFLQITNKRNNINSTMKMDDASHHQEASVTCLQMLCSEKDTESPRQYFPQICQNIQFNQEALSNPNYETIYKIIAVTKINVMKDKKRLRNCFRLKKAKKI